jgi:predicted nucleic acid-binding protein
MIAVDNDVISYFWIQMDVERSALARRARRQNANWIAPRLWRSEFRNVLRGYLVGDYLTHAEALEAARNAEADMADNAYEVPTADVLRLVDATGHSAYDCEYVALAQRLGVPLVTGDAELPDLFPDTAVLLETFVDR